MNIFAQIHSDLTNLIVAQYEQNEVDLQSMNLELPKNPKHGDLSCNAAMILTRQLQQNPLQIAQTLASALLTLPYVQSIEIAGPGFLNITLKKAFWLQKLQAILANPEAFLSLDIGKGKKVNIEYASPNPTGPMHIGHARGAIFGEVLANILIKCGYHVDKEYYINDAGNQITVLVESLYQRYKEALGLEYRLPEDGYPGDYLKDIAQAAAHDFGGSLLDMNSEELYSKLAPYAIDKIMLLIKNDLNKLGVGHNIFTSEKHDVLEQHYIEKGIEKLRAKGLIYSGVLAAPKGKTDANWEEREQLLYRSTAFGDDVDRPLQKSDGTYTYLAGDIGYHLHKLERQYDIMVLTLGADHSGYVNRLTSCVESMDENVKFTIVLFQLVNLLKDGKPFKMSKRAGNFITVDDVLSEIHPDVLKFMMLTAKSDTTLDIDFSLAKKQSKDNPVFYVQYAHTRASSILRKAADLKLPVPDALDQQSITLGTEMTMLKLILSFHRVVISAAAHLDPIKLINYLQDMAAEFHSLWHSEYIFIDPDNLENTAYRVAICRAFATTLSAALQLLNIEAMEYM